MRDIYKKMKKSAMGRIWVGLVCIILGVGMTLVMLQSGPIGYMLAKDNVFDLESYNLEVTSTYDDSVQKFYTFHGNMLLDWYAESENQGRYYILPTVDKKFMGLYVSSADVSTAEQIVSEYQTYLTSGDEAAEPSTFLDGKGYVYGMSDKERGYFDDYMNEFLKALGVDSPESYLSHETMYICSMTDVISGSDWAVTICGAIFLILGIVYVLSFFTGRYSRQPKKYIQTFGLSESDVEADMAYAVHKKNIDIGRKYAMCYGQTCYLIPYSQLLWTYVNITTTKHKTYGITVGKTKTYQVLFVMRDHSKCSLAVKNEDMGHEIVKEITTAAPHVIGGYHQELEDMYNNNFAELIRIVNEHKAELEGNLSANTAATVDPASDADPFM